MKNFFTRVSKPLLFVVVFLIAAFSLSFLQEKKTQFDKTENKPLLLVDNNEQNPPQTAFIAKVDKLAAVIRGLNPNDSPCSAKIVAEKERKEQKRTKILCAASSAIKYQNIKNVDDLIARLNEAMQQNKEIELKEIQNKLNKSYKAEYDTDEEKGIAIYELNKFAKTDPNTGETIKDTKILIDDIKRTYPTEGLDPQTNAGSANFIVRRALKNEIDNAKKRKEYTYEELEKSITDYFAGLKKSKENTTLANQAQMENINEDYQAISKNIYTALGEKKNVKIIFQKEDQKALVKAIFDDKSSFSIIYSVARIMLLAILIFSLLYVILIIFKNLFFLSASGDNVTKQIETIFNKSNAPIAAGGAVAGSKSTAAVLTAVAAIGIGTAVLAGSQIPNIIRVADVNNVESPDAIKKLDDIANRLKSRRGDNTGGTGGGEPNPEQIKIDELAASIGELNNRVTDLQNEIGGFPRGSSSGGGQDYTDIFQNIADNLKTIDGNFLETQRNSKEIWDVLGTKQSNPFTGTLLGNLQALRNSYERTSFDVGSINDNIAFLNPTVTNINRSTDYMKPLVEDTDVRTRTMEPLVKGTDKKASNIDNNTNDIGRNLIGNSGKNIFSQTQTLFTPQRYLVSNFAISALKNHSNYTSDKEGFRDMVTVLEQLISNAEMSDDKLFDAMRARAGKRWENWKKWKQLILSYTRVARW